MSGHVPGPVCLCAGSGFGRFGAAVLQAEVVELIDELLAVQQVMLRFPRVLFAPVAFPSDQIFPLALFVLPFVHNPFHLQEDHVHIYPDFRLINRLLINNQLSY